MLCDKTPSQELLFVTEDGTNNSSLHFLTFFLAALHFEGQIHPFQPSHSVPVPWELPTSPALPMAPPVLPGPCREELRSSSAPMGSLVTQGTLALLLLALLGTAALSHSRSSLAPPQAVPSGTGTFVEKNGQVVNKPGKGYKSFYEPVALPLKER